ncbi:MAG: hypothetical protein AAGJ08_09470 [Cyanobacteria bacterium P01_H01_bin.35]
MILEISASYSLAYLYNYSAFVVAIAYFSKPSLATEKFYSLKHP